MKRVMIRAKVVTESNVIKLCKGKKLDRAKNRRRCERKNEYNGEALFQSTKT